MRKKLLAVALSSIMAMSLFACGSSGDEGDTTTKAANNKTTEATTTGDAADATGDSTGGEGDTPEATTTVKPTTTEEEEISKDPIYFEDFNGETSKIKVVLRGDDNPDTGAAVTAMIPTEDYAKQAGKVALYEPGIDGTNALYLDGSYGAILDYDWKDMETYTVSFWINPARYSQYGTMLTVGQDLLGTAGTCAWMNITKVKDWLGIDMAPVIWSRSMTASTEAYPNGKEGVNPGEEVWPWYVEAYCAAADGMQMTNKEWHHVVIVLDGSKTGWDPVLLEEVPGTVQGTTYIDGQLFGTGPVAKYTMVDASDVYLGINCWDVLQKAHYDNIGVYDYALTPGQVFKLYNSQKGAN